MSLHSIVILAFHGAQDEYSDLNQVSDSEQDPAAACLYCEKTGLTGLDALKEHLVSAHSVTKNLEYLVDVTTRRQEQGMCNSYWRDENYIPPYVMCEVYYWICYRCEFSVSVTIRMVALQMNKQKN